MSLSAELLVPSRSRWSANLLVLSLFAAVVVLIWFGPLGVRWLHGPDEGRYAEIAREMLASGQWATPRLNGVLYFEKPPLVYWLTALSFELFGVNEFAARLWPAVVALLPLPFLWWVSVRSFGTSVATCAVAILASSFWWVANGHFLNLDMSLSAFMAIFIAMIWSANLPGVDESQATRRMRVAWVAMGLAMLSKGLVALVVLGIGTAAYSLWARDWRLLKRLSLFEGVLIVLTLCGPWLLWMESRHPGFLKFFIIHEHFQRFTSTVHRRSGPWYYFVPVLLIGAFPWTSHLPGALRLGFKRRSDGFQVERFLLAQAATVFAFFSLSGSKLPSYILPMFAPLAVLFALRLHALAPRRLGRHLVISACAVALCSLAALAVVERSSLWGADPGVLRFGMLVLASLGQLAVLGFVLARWGDTLSSLRSVTLVALAALASMQIMLAGYQFVEVERSPVRWLSQAVPPIDVDTPLFSVGAYDQTLPFYLRRPMTLVVYVDEFETGIAREPERQLPTLDAFVERWRASSTGVAFLSREHFDQLRQQSLPMIEIGGDQRRVLVRHP